jgi:hypothetical protein
LLRDADDEVDVDKVLAVAELESGFVGKSVSANDDPKKNQFSARNIIVIISITCKTDLHHIQSASNH